MTVCFRMVQNFASIVAPLWLSRRRRQREP